VLCLLFFITLFFFTLRRPTISTLFPYTTLFRSHLINLLQRLSFSLWEQEKNMEKHDKAEYGKNHISLPCNILKRRGHKHGRLMRSEEHTSELQSRFDLVCRLLLEKKKKDSEENT